MDYLTLPTALEVGGRSYAIRYDFRAVIDVINILNSTEYQETEKYFCALKVFYVDFDSIPMRDYQEAQEIFENTGLNRSEDYKAAVDDMVDIVNMVPEIREDVVIVCLLACAVDGKISFKEKQWIKRLID